VGRQINGRLVSTKATQEDFDADMDLLIAAQGEPFVGPTVYAQFCVARRAASEGVKVLLEGQGADELFGGYDGYPYDVLSSLWTSGDVLSAARFFWGWGEFPGRSKVQLAKGLISREARKRGYLRRGVGLIKDGFDLKIFDHSALSSSFTDGNGVQNENDGRFLARALGRDLSGGGLESLLRHGDRNSMAWSIENRVPFLTTSMADICLSVPENFLVSSRGLTKRLLREAFRGIAPDAVLDRTDKIGFGTSLTPTFMREESSFSNELDALEILSFLDMDSVVASYGLRDSSQVRQFSSSQRWRFYNYAKWAELMLSATSSR
jgi:asparagine synthase (glutamine-hydrolysing)